MKYPFNKERAMAGEPVVTRDGRKVTDLDTLDLGSYKIKARIVCGGIEGYTDKGYYWPTGRESNFDLFMLTPDPAPSAPIPFDWDKYNSGEWDAVYRDGSKPKGVYHIAVLEVQQILTISDEGYTMWHYLTGEYLRSKTQHGYDLLLTPKQVTRWFNLYSHIGITRVYAGMVFNTEAEAKENTNEHNGYTCVGTYSFTTKAKS